MGAAREKGQADFDLERFIDMFDEALTSRDERVVNALRSLMMMVILTKPESRDLHADKSIGPLRQVYDDLHNLNRRMHRMEEDFQHIRQKTDYYEKQNYNKWDVDPGKMYQQPYAASDVESFKQLMKREYELLQSYKTPIKK